MKNKTSCILICILLLGTSVAFAEYKPVKASYSQTADYGDAPDPTFPSLSISDGPYHLDTHDSYVGWTATSEEDALVPDKDMDDGEPIIFASISSGTWTGWVYVPITIDPDAPYIDRYLNVLLDCDSSGSWCNQPGEWIVRNYKVYYLPGQTYWYCIGGFSWVTFYSGMHWLRVTVSDSRINANVEYGWDGRDPTGSGFTRGETEDWLLQWHYSRHESVPPNDPLNPPGPVPLPPCSKAYTVYQKPSPPHRGHSGSFEVCVKNLGDHPLHITEGPIVTGPWGDPIDIDLGTLVCETIQPGEEACVTGTWEFQEEAPNKAWCDWDIVGDPDEKYVIAANVGNYISPTSDESTGGIFQEGINDPPNKPSKPSGPTEGKIKRKYTYTTSATDANGDDIQYGWDWDGDMVVDEWTGFYGSGESASTSHSWNQQGTYNIRVKARDRPGDESEWSDPVVVTIPKDRTVNVAKVSIIQPTENTLYIRGKPYPLPSGTIIIGEITVVASAFSLKRIDKLEFYVDDELKHTETNRLSWLLVPWLWDETIFFKHTLKVIAYDKSGDTATAEIDVWIFNI
jgi:hypothetical protein